MKILIFFLLISLNSYSWTYNPNTGRGFSSNNIDIYIANTSCTKAGFTTSQYVNLIKGAVKKYWNAVPTSALYLDVKGIDSSIDITGDDHDDALIKTKNNTILAGCNESADDFTNSGILGSAQMQCNGDTCKAVLILNANDASKLDTKSESEVEAIIAHEIGHAIGIGHTEISHSLMYFSVGGKYQKWLSMDDINAVSALYPHDPEFLGLLGSCGTIEYINQDLSQKKNFSSLISAISGFVFILFILFFRSFLFNKRIDLYPKN